MIIRPAILAIAAGGLVLAACTGNITPEQKHEMGCIAGTVSGAVAGAALGSLIGAGTGNVIATGTGAVAGGLAGNRLTCS